MHGIGNAGGEGPHGGRHPSLPLDDLPRFGKLAGSQIDGRRNGEAVDIEKKRLSNLYRKGARLAGERIVEDLVDDEKAAKIPANQKAFIVGILTEKSELLAGGATSRVAHSKVEPSNAISTPI
jgi:hypothetical protein